MKLIANPTCKKPTIGGIRDFQVGSWGREIHATKTKITSITAIANLEASASSRLTSSFY